MATNKTTANSRKRHLAYEPHLITYIDILGFRELVAEKPPNFISKTIRRVREVTEPDERIRKANKEHYVNFSDLIVHTVPILSPSNRKSPEGLVFLEINHLVLAQVALLGEGFLIRGALVLGDVESSYGVLFGPGLISAYELERGQAQFPRIVVDAKLIEAVKTNPLLRNHEYEEEMEYISRLIKRDDDGVIFIDYLGSMQDQVEPAEYLEFLFSHKDLVERNITAFKDNKRVLPKYLWLRKYHNAIVQARLKPDLHEELLVGGLSDAADVPPLMPPFRPLIETSGDAE